MLRCPVTEKAIFDSIVPLARPENLDSGAFFVVFQFPLILSLLCFYRWAELQRSNKAPGSNNRR